MDNTAQRTYTDYDIATTNRINAAWLNAVDQLRHGVADPTKGAEKLQFMQAGTGAEPRSMQDKARDIVSIFDFMTEVQRNDVQGGIASVNVSAAVQKAFDKCYGSGNPMRQLVGWGRARLEDKISFRNGFQGEGNFDNGGGLTFVWHGSAQTVFEYATPYDGGLSFRQFKIDCRNVTTPTLMMHFKHGLVSATFDHVRFQGWTDGLGFFVASFKEHDGLLIQGVKQDGVSKADISINTFNKVYFLRCRQGYTDTDPITLAAGGESTFRDCFGNCEQWVFRTNGRGNLWQGGDFASRVGTSVWKFSGQYASGSVIEGINAETETSGDSIIICDADTSPAGSMGSIIGGKLFTGSWVNDLGVGTRLQRWTRQGDEDSLTAFDGRMAFLRNRSTLTTDLALLGGVVGQGGKFLTVRGASDAVCGVVALGNSAGGSSDAGGANGMGVIIGNNAGSDIKFQKTSDGTTLTEFLRITRTGQINNVGVAATMMLEMKDAAAADADEVSNIGSTTTGSMRLFACNQAGSATYNSANAAMKVAQNVTTSRSINAAGTINASGADYAEYERKRLDCAVVAKGQVIGFDASGLLTDRWSLLVRPGVKSTNPSYVGGDAWGVAVGEAPAKPVQREATIENEMLEVGETVNEYAERVKTWNDTHREWLKDREGARPEKPHRRHPVYEPRVTAPGETADEFSVRLGAWQKAHAAWAARLEAERFTVDRIAYSGKVPCNVTGAQPGDYIVAQQGPSDSIVGAAVPNPTFEQYRMAVGRVNRILPDGRAEIAIIIS